MVRHGHIEVNGRKCNIPSALVKIGDVVSVRETSKNKPTILAARDATAHAPAPNWIDVDREGLKGRITSLPQRSDLVQTVGLIGLGNMGLPMAQTLRRKGHAVRGFDLDARRRAAAADSGVALAANHGDVFASCPLTLLSLPNAAAVRAVVEGAEGFIGRAAPGSIVVDTSTLSLAVKEQCRSLFKEAELLDCPISGTGAQAKVRDLVVLGDGRDPCGGRPIRCERDRRRLCFRHQSIPAADRASH